MPQISYEYRIQDDRSFVSQSRVEVSVTWNAVGLLF